LKGSGDMQQAIKTITLSLPYGLGSVNCYLLEIACGFVLIDTGGSNQRARLEEELESWGCRPGSLQLILLTHGDFDHTGNAAFLRERYGAKIAMHAADRGMVEGGDMFWNRDRGNVVLRVVAPILFRFSRAERFTPDLCVNDGDDLSELGFRAQVIALPGHSKGSIGVLTRDGELFCGDLLENRHGPAQGAIVDDSAACDASIERLRTLEIATVYPGHGRSFALAELMQTG
jgi:hydroxyacylglutathione hydrolase